MTFRADGGVELLIDSTRIFAARSAAIWLFMSASKGDITIVTKRIVSRDSYSKRGTFSYFHNQRQLVAESTSSFRMKLLPGDRHPRRQGLQ